MPTTRGWEKLSGSQKILHTKVSLTVGAAQGQQGDRRTDTTSSPTSQKETKDPTQSAHYRLWGPGFLNVSLVPEEQELTTPTQAPTQAMATASMNLDALASLQADELQKLIKSLQGLAASRQEGTTPTRKPPAHTSTTLEGEEIRWERSAPVLPRRTGADHSHPSTNPSYGNCKHEPGRPRKPSGR